MKDEKDQPEFEKLHASIVADVVKAMTTVRGEFSRPYILDMNKRLSEMVVNYGAEFCDGIGDLMTHLENTNPEFKKDLGNFPTGLMAMVPAACAIGLLTRTFLVPIEGITDADGDEGSKVMSAIISIGLSSILSAGDIPEDLFDVHIVRDISIEDAPARNDNLAEEPRQNAPGSNGIH